MAYKIFLDTNILIDFIEQRSFDKEAVNELFKLAEKNDIEIFISESVITTALYVTKNTAQIDRVLKITSVICIRETEIKKALSSSFKDKEDAILYYGSLHAKIDFFITRNEKDFAKNSLTQLPVMNAKALLAKLKAPK